MRVEDAIIVTATIVLGSICFYYDHYVKPKKLNIQQEIYVNDHYAYIKPPKSELVEIFTDDGVNIKICKGGINKCQTILME